MVSGNAKIPEIPLDDKKAVEILDNMLSKAGSIYYTNEELQAIKFAKKIIEKDRWISVKDRLPKENIKVIFCAKWDKGSREVLIGYHNHIHKEWVSDDFYIAERKVTAWMPLPEAYANDEGE